MKWSLRPASEDVSGAIPPGVYALQNKASSTYVTLAQNEIDICCAPEADFGNTQAGVKQVCRSTIFSLSSEIRPIFSQWEILPFGAGYTIRLVGTDQYCTLQEDGTKITLSTLPAAWRIVTAKSPLNAIEGVQVVQ